MTSHAQRRAALVLDEVPILVPEDLHYLNKIMWERGAIVVEEPLMGAEAQLLIVPGHKSVITLSSSITNSQRKRFAISHELGHLEMHRRKLELTLCSETDIDDSRPTGLVDLEYEANIFAACFLMPARFVSKRLSADEPSFDTIRDIQDQFDVSLTAASLRMMDFSLEPMAAVYSENGVIRRFKCTPDFEKMEVFVNVRGDVERNTCAGRMFAGLQVKDGWHDARASDWLREGRYARDAIIKEWSVNMPNYRAVLSLLWIEDEIYPTDEFGWALLD